MNSYTMLQPAMNARCRHAVSAVVLILWALAAPQVSAQAGKIPAAPVGALSAYPTVVQTGTKPTLTWNILYPSKVSDLVEVNPPGTLIPNQTVYATVQIVGSETLCRTDCTTLANFNPPSDLRLRFAAAYRQFVLGAEGNANASTGGNLVKAWGNIGRLYAAAKELYASPTLAFGPAGQESMSPFHSGGGANSQPMIPVTVTRSQPLPTEARVSVNRGAYQQIFYGTQADVDPAKALYVKRLLANQTLDFGGRFVLNGEWSPFFTTNSTNLQVVALVKGDIPPTTFSLYRQNFLAEYLKPYLDSAGRVNIGPLSVLIVMELDNSDHVRGCFDYQDMVLIVTLGSKHPNNGHGNNLDGVDSSNPGQGHGGPNGEIDPSGGVDDEIR